MLRVLFFRVLTLAVSVHFRKYRQRCFARGVFRRVVLEFDVYFKGVEKTLGRFSAKCKPLLGAFAKFPVKKQLPVSMYNSGSIFAHDVYLRDNSSAWQDELLIDVTVRFNPSFAALS